MAENESLWQKISPFFDVLSKAATIGTAALAIIITYSNQGIEQKLKDLDSIKKAVEINQDSLTFDREFKFKIYQLAIDAIKSKDSVQQEAAYVTVDAMVADTVFKAGLLSLFVKSKAVIPEIRKAATVATFDIQESNDPTPVYSPSDKIYVDIIYLAEVPHTKLVARKIYNALQRSAYYQVGIKPFTESRNKLPVYRIEQNQIRYDSTEKAKAEKLSEVVNQILPEGEPRFITQPTEEGKTTDRYISLFIVEDRK